MKSKPQLFAIAACMIVLFDLAASFASRLLQFDYGRLSWITFCLYGFCGYLAFRYHGILGGFQAGLMAGLTDSTVGWTLSTAIHPYLRYPIPRLGIVAVSVTVVFVTFAGGFFGFTGAVIAKGTSLMREGEPGESIRSS